MMPTLGKTTQGASKGGLEGGVHGSQGYTASEGGTITKICAYLYQYASAKCRLGVYKGANFQGAQKIDECAEFIPVTGLNERTPLTGASFSAGDKIWIVAMGQTWEVEGYYDTLTGAGKMDYMAYGPLPSSLNEDDTLNRDYSFYIVYSTAGATYTKTWQSDALFKKLGITKTAIVDTAFKKLGITKPYTADVLFKKKDIRLQKQVDALFKKLNILKQFGVDVDLLKRDIIKAFAIDARFGAMATYTISKQIDAIFKKLNVQKTFSIDVWFGTVGAVTCTKTFAVDVMFRYKIKLPSPLGLTFDGQLVIPLKREVWVGD